jgi:preprotein translocase subunit SecA
LNHVEIAYEAPPLQAQSFDSLTTPANFMEALTPPAAALPPPAPVALQPQAQRSAAPEQRVATDPSTWGKVGRNELCPCGSGKKYKHCHGQIS